jgi:ligand-binding sensor protein
MKLIDIVSLGKWLELEQKINERSGLNAAVFDVDGVRITDFKKWANKLCPLIKADEKGRSYICAVAHQNIAAQAERSHQAVIAECDAGLMKLAVPIFLYGEFLGVAGGCGCKLGNGEVETFTVKKTIDITEEKLKNVTGDIPVMTQKQAQSHVEFIQSELDKIINEYQKGI